MSVTNMNKKEEEFLKENFKAGEYYNLSMLINKKQLESFLQILQSFNLTLAIIPLNDQNGYQSINIFVKIKDIDVFSKNMMDYFKLDVNNKVQKH